MFEYHGWLVIEPAPHETDTEDDDRRSAAAFAQGIVDSETAAGIHGLRDLHWVNGQAQLHFGGFRNRRNAEFNDLPESLTELVRRAPGTYGVIYYLNDEEPAHPDEFRVLVVRRGEIAEYADTFLSPTVPMIEDPYVFPEDP